MLYPYFIIKDGFKYTRGTDLREHKSFVIESRPSDEMIDYINTHQIKEVTTRGIENFERLDECPSIETLHIWGIWPDFDALKAGEILNFNADGLYKMHNLKTLSIGIGENDKLKIDLSRIPSLKEFYGSQKYITNLDQAVNLEILDIIYYKKKNLLELKNLKKLKLLTITSSSIVSLEGCEFLESLDTLRLYYNRSLEDISTLCGNADTVTFLDIENCGRISDFSVLETLKNLEVLSIYGRNKIPSIQFINKLKHLDSFDFDINVLDGDLTPCLRLNAADCFVSRKHYNLKNDQLPKNFKTNAD